LIHLDQEYWKPGWTKPSDGEWTSKLQGLVARPAWIMDGNFGGTLPMRIAVADTVIFLDFPRSMCVWSVLIRTARTYGRKRVDMADGCTERIDRDFLLYVWRWHRNSRPRVLAALEAFRGELIILRERRDVAKLIADFRV
jgi:adenylate kinase family enzyme